MKVRAAAPRFKGGLDSRGPLPPRCLYSPPSSGAAGRLSERRPRSPRARVQSHMATKKLTNKDLDQFGNLLRQMLGIVTGDIQRLELEAFSDASDKPQVSVEDSGGEINSVELSLELLERDGNTAREIMDALDRIKDGTFGTCEICDKPITKTRLQAMPHARNCIDCQRNVEKDMI